jgi:hypothetical protein
VAGQTALHLAASAPSGERTVNDVEEGVEVIRHEPKGWAVLKMLLSAPGCDTTLKNEQGETAEELAGDAPQPVLRWCTNGTE